MTGRSWIDAILAAGATPASFVPDSSAGRSDAGAATGVELVEDRDLQVHHVAPAPWRPPAAAFLDGFQQWRVVAYDRIVPVVRGWVAAAVRRRGPDRRLRTVHEVGREVVVTFVDRLSPPVRSAVESAGVTVRAIPEDRWGPPGAALTAARLALESERVRIEREAGAWWAGQSPADEWLLVDGVLSEHGALAAHPRALGIVKSPGAQYFEGADLERALTLAPEHRTSVFRPAARGSGAVLSWYLRLWPWEGNDLLYGLVRVEGPDRPDTIARAGALSAWLLTERAPLAAPDARWDRLLYPLHDVETYLRTRAPAYLAPPSVSRLPARPA